MKIQVLKKFALILFAIIFFVVLCTNLFGRGWIFYHDGPYMGKVFDADSGVPVSGAIIVGLWHLELYGGPGGPLEKICSVQETVTNKNGEFKLPRIWCFHPWLFTKLYEPRCIVFKNGYVSYPPPFELRSIYASRNREVQNFSWGIPTTVKLYKARTISEREVTIQSVFPTIDFKFYKKIKKFILTVNKECRQLGLDPVYEEALK